MKTLKQYIGADVPGEVWSVRERIRDDGERRVSLEQDVVITGNRTVHEHDASGLLRLTMRLLLAGERLFGPSFVPSVLHALDTERNEE